MITWQTLRKSIDNKQFGKGICTSDDEKPVENIANGSELIEIDTGKRCVFDLGREEWIEYGTGETRTQKPGNVRTEVYEGLLSELLTFENIQKYGAALDAGAIGVAQGLDTTDEKMAEVKMGMIYLPPSSDTDLDGFFVFGAGTFGWTFADMLELSSAEWNRTFSDEAEYIEYIENQFKPEVGASVVVQLTKSSVRGYFAYINMNGNPTVIKHDDIENLGRFRFTFYYMDEGVEPSGSAKVTTETISGPMSQLFAGWTEEKFTQLIEDIHTRRASARVSITMGDDFFDAQLMVLGSNSPSYSTLATAFFMPQPSDPCLRILWVLDGTDAEGIRVDTNMLLFSPSNETWIAVDDNTLSQMTGQSSYDLIITRIEEE